MAENLHEARARAAKVRLIVALVATELPDGASQRDLDATADCLASFPQSDRDRFAARAGCKSGPSPTTWQLVVDAVRAGAVERRAS